MNDKLENILKQISESHNFETLLIARDMKKLFTDTDLDEDVKDSYIDFIVNSSTDAKNIEKLMDDFNKYNNGEPENPLLEVMKSIEKSHDFSTLLIARDMKKLFTDTDINDETRERYLKFIPNAKSRGDVKALFNEFMYWDETAIEKPETTSDRRAEPNNFKTQTSVIHRKDTRFEKARIIGARALQISYGAPILIDGCDDILDPIDIAMKEYDAGVIPITVLRKYE